MSFSKAKLGVAAIVALLLAVVFTPTPAQAANWSAGLGQFNFNNSDAIAAPGGPFKVTYSAGSVTPISFSTNDIAPAAGGNYRHSVLLDRPDSDSLQLSIGFLPTLPIRSAILSSKCPSTETGMSGGVIASYPILATTPATVGLGFKSNGQVAFVDGSTFLQNIGTGNATAGLTFSHGKLRSGSYVSPNYGCDPRTGPIKMQAANICLDTPNQSNADGLRLVTVTCDPTKPSQNWTYNPTSNQISRNGMCMAVNTAVGQLPGQGTHVVIKTCDNGSAQVWNYNPPPVNVIPVIRSGTSTYCLDIDNASTDPGTQMQVYDCHDAVAAPQQDKNAQSFILPLG